MGQRQIVDYSQPGRQAAFALAGGLATLPPAPPLPEQLPEPPPAPLSYLSDLVDHLSRTAPLTHEQQHQILIQLQPALRSADPEERRGGRYVLEMFSKRNDLYADVDRSTQAAMVFELRTALDAEEDDGVGADIRELLQLLRDRREVVHAIVQGYRLDP